MVPAQARLGELAVAPDRFAVATAAQDLWTALARASRHVLPRATYEHWAARDPLHLRAAVADEPAAAAVKDEGPVKKEKVEEDEELDGEPVEQAEKKELRLAEVTIEAISQIWFRRIESWLRP